VITMPTLLSTHEVCKATGLTYRVLDYWCRTGVLEPHLPADGSGSRRAFTMRQCEHLGVMAQVQQYLRRYVTVDNGHHSGGGVSTDTMHSLYLALTEHRPWLINVLVDETGHLETGALV
jgi:hypothetical protein